MEQDTDKQGLETDKKGKRLPIWRKRLNITLWTLFLSCIVMLVIGASGATHFVSTLWKYGFSSQGYRELLRTSDDPDIRFGNFAPSGEKITLNYRPTINNQDNITYMGVLDISIGKLQLLRPPSDYKIWYDGSFSSDGKYIVFSFAKKDIGTDYVGLGLLNLSDMSYKIIKTSNDGIQHASFSSDMNSLIYTKSEYTVGKNEDKSYAGKYLYELNLTNGKETRLVNHPIYALWGKPKYLPNGERYIFAAEFGDALHNPYQDNNTYILDRNSTQARPARPFIIHNGSSRFVDISRDGKQILCIAISDIHKYNQDKKFNYELFMYENNQIRQLTNYQWMIIDAVLAPDAKKTVFVADTLPSRGSERKLYLMDIDSNKTSQIRIKSENITWIDVKNNEK